MRASTTPTFSGAAGAGIAEGYLSIGAGLTPSSAADTFGGSGFNQQTLADAIANEDFLSVRLAPAAGYAVNVSEISYYLGKSSSGSVLFTAYLTSSLTGFSVDAVLDTFSFTSGSAPLHTVSFVSPVFEAVSAPIEFRIYGVAETTDTLRIRDYSGVPDLAISGSVAAVPEPSTWATALGSASIIVALFARRKRSRPAKARTRVAARPTSSGPAT